LSDIQEGTKAFPLESKPSLRTRTELREVKMLELIELIMRSPLGGAIGSAFQDSLYGVVMLSDCDECGFNDLGKLLFGGVILAIVVGISFSLIRQRVKDRRSSEDGFVSIRASERDLKTRTDTTEYSEIPRSR
jgi:hypothetical protein